MMELGLVLSGLTIFGAILNSMRNKWGFIVWIIANIGWIIFNALTETYSQIPVWLAMTVISIFGFINWKNHEQEIG